MKSAILILLAMLMIGCSKHGAKSHLMDGGQPEPTLVDRNLPGPDGQAASDK